MELVNVRTTRFNEHAVTNLHAHVMGLFTKQHASSVCEYAPITAAILKPLMDDATREQTKQRYDIACIAKESVLFTKMES